MLKMTLKQGKRYRRDKFKHPILLYLIIPFLSFFIYILNFSALTLETLPDFFYYTSPKIKYETFKLSFDSKVGEDVQNAIISALSDIELEGIKRFEFVKRGGYKILPSEEETHPVYFKEYAPVGHIYWINGKTTLDEIHAAKELYVTSDEYELAQIFLKEALGDDIGIVESEDLPSTLLADEKKIGIVPVEDLNPSYKVLELDDKYCLSDSAGCIRVEYGMKYAKNSEFVSSIISKNMGFMYGESVAVDTENMVKINMSGVVAMSRNLARKIDSSKDYAYPARDIGKFLADADLTHVSNESSFVKGCVGYTGMSFCSKPEYIATLEASGVDIVELTGNHNNDHGAKNNTATIERYVEEGWDYFGGGLNKEDASKILYKDIKGSKLAFMGYNWYDTMYGSSALAGEDRAGANSYSVEKLTRDIKEAKENGALTIVTFQFQECYSYPASDVIYPICYKPLSSPDQKKVFRQAIDLGADIVIGTQAHQPQTYEVYKESIIFYGLGNLYFDQDRWIGTRQGIVLSLFVEDSNLRQVRITPTIIDSNLIPRVAGKTDSNLLLNLLKSARNF